MNLHRVLTLIRVGHSNLGDFSYMVSASFLRHFPLSGPAGFDWPYVRAHLSPKPPFCGMPCSTHAVGANRSSYHLHSVKVPNVAYMREHNGADDAEEMYLSFDKHNCITD